MAVYTKDDLVQRTLVRLNVVGFGEAVELEARARVTDPLDGILDELEADGVIEFDVDTHIPGAALDPLSVIIAQKLSDDFGLTADQITTLAQRAQAATEKLRRLKWQGYSSWLPRRGQFF